MTATIFVDGEAGTTGLQIRARLQGRDDITLLSLPDADRKSRDARLAAFAAADVSILCLPDAAVHEIAPDLRKMDVRVIDASTAHRTDPDWVFGFPEVAPGARDQIANARRVSNPGCYSTGAIALLRPLIDAGVIAPDHPVTINALSGYSGGGKAMIAAFESGETTGGFVYATGQRHKHLPEIVARSGLSRRPIFVAQVGQFSQGMIVQVPLHLKPGGPEQAMEVLADRYAGQRFVQVVPRDELGDQIDPQQLNDTNLLKLSVDGDAETGATVLIAVLDNLGKGASGAAVQSLNLMIGADEGTGL